MRQVLQSLKTGAIEVIEAPAPVPRPRHLLIESRVSLISAGTERMLLEFGRGNLIEKALQQPERVRQTLEKARTDGLRATFEAVRAKLDQPIPLGYCNAGEVIAQGAETEPFRIGDRVVSNGPHAELFVVGRNLAARIPDGVSDEAAAFTPLAAIALQGCRLAAPAFGETVAVIGLGLIGLLAVQLLRAHGAQVIGIDFAKDRLAIAARFGAMPVDLSAGEDPVRAALAATGGLGADAVLITAATDSDAPVKQAAQMSRKRGRIVLVGVAGLKLDRADFYEKELTFQVSCSYGPGRYDPAYEQRGEDYPPGFVRWTEQRNFEAVLAAMAAGRLDVAPLISGRFGIDGADAAYDRLAAKGNSDLGLLLTYPRERAGKLAKNVPLVAARAAGVAGEVAIALIGAGGFGGRTLAPSLKAAGARLKTIVSRGGVSAALEGRKAGFEEAASEPDAVFADPAINAVIIATRHDSHARLAIEALQAGKQVFVEKPLGLTLDEIDRVEHACAGPAAAPILMVGFNRRFSSFSLRMKEALATIIEPKCFIATINAGVIPANHWTQNALEGGGRIIGEACHFIDLLRFWAGAQITRVSALEIGRPAGDGLQSDKATINLSFADGSIGTIHYFANGPKSLSKERYETFAGGRYFKLDNFKRLETLGGPKSAAMSGAQDKGHGPAMKAFIDAVRSGAPAPIPLEEILEVSRRTIEAAALAAGSLNEPHR